MTLAPGIRLGPYEILGLLGSGGMGEVYRARDTRLGRDVAIKVLPDELARDPERLRRFEGESRAASALSDPHIVTVFDVGEDRGVSWIATELVEGTDLRALLGSDPLPLRRTIDLAEQIASGLAAAHERGIVHRDLKPENVLVAKSGLAKIADFGLAKVAVSPGGRVSELPTTDGHSTAAGIVMGTVAYMSPEQARGAPVDFRSDQFAFGAILHEMLTGRAAFHRGNPAETMAAILREDPAPLPTSVPAPLRWIVERCLSKDRESRYGATSDLHRDLRSLREHWSEAVAAPAAAAGPAPERLRDRVSLPAVASVVAFAAAVGIVAGKFVWRGPPKIPPLYQQVTFESGHVAQARFTPDGQTILYSASWRGGPSKIYSTRTDSTESSELPLPDSRLLAISPAGKVAIDVGGTLAEVALAGGAPREILQDVLSADWPPDGKALAVAHGSNHRYRLEYPIGTVLVDPGFGGVVRDVRFSPDGRSIAFLRQGPSAGGASTVVETSVEVYDLSRRKETTLTSGWEAWGLAWRPDGKEVWFSARRSGSTSGGLVVNAVDLAGRTRIVARAPWVLYVEDIFRDGRVLLKHGYWPSTTIYRRADPATEKDVSWQEFSIAQDLSPDGKTLLLSEVGISGGSEGAVFLRKTDGLAPAVRLGGGRPGGLSPDGKWVITMGTAGGKLGLLPTGAGQPVDLTAPGITYLESGWFPDGKRVVFYGRRSTESSARPFEQSIQGGAPQPLPFAAPAIGPISPDGSKMAIATEAGEIRLFPLDGSAPSTVPGSRADEVLRWSTDASSLFVRAGELPAKLSRVDVRTGAATLVAQLAPSDLSGVVGIEDRPPITPDGNAYAYSFIRFLDDLYVVTGIR